MGPDFHEILIIGEDAGASDGSADGITRCTPLQVCLVQLNLDFRKTNGDDKFILRKQILCQRRIVPSLLKNHKWIGRWQLLL